MDRAWWTQRVGDELALLIEDRLALGGRDIGDVLVELADEGKLTQRMLRKLVDELEKVITLSEGPVLDSGRTPLRVVGELGRGAMGFVHTARDPSLGRNVAVKKLNAAAIDNPVLLGRFKAEAQITAQLDHPGIVPVYTLSIDGRGIPSYAMKLIRGRTLSAYLADCRTAWEKGEALDEDHELDARLELFLQICNAVAYAHSRGVLHRDLKPDNVMLGAFHEVLVVDWGVAKLLGRKEDSIEGLPYSTAGEGTELGTVIGTPQYCSPEQARGENDQLDARSDQFALGLILFELVCLSRAYVGKTSHMVLLKAADARVEPVRHAYGQPVARELQAILGKVLTVDRDARYASVEELADDVRRYLRDEPVHAAPDTALQRMGRFVARHRQATLSVVAGLVIAVLAIALLAVLGAVAARELAEQAAAERERQVGRALALTKERASAIDAELYTTEAVVSGIAAAAAEVLDRPGPADLPLYLARDFGTPDGPPDLVQSPYYDASISLGFVDLHVPDAIDVDSVRPQLAQLASLRPQLRRGLLGTEGTDLIPLSREEVDQRIVNDGILGTWTYVATEEGVLAGYPGVGGYPGDLDPRQRPWYRVGFEGRGTQWSALTIEEGDFGLLLTCTLAVRDAEGRRLGVAATDLAFDQFIDRYLDPDGVPAGTEAYLVDAEGRVVIQSSQKDTARTMTEYAPARFPDEAALSTLHSEPSGHLVRDDGSLLSWSRLSAVPWTYVLEIPEPEAL